MILPLSAVIATRDRTSSLDRMLKSLEQQTHQPQQIIVVDASCDSRTRVLCEQFQQTLGSRVVYLKAAQHGAATQRNQGVPRATAPFVLFCDDDIVFQPACIERLWNGLVSDPALGGINAMIVNQQYVMPGAVTRTIFWLMHGKREQTYAGKCIGPALNLLPEDREDLPAVVPVEWLNTTCTLYRREALPDPPFPDVFTGYSLMEDVALSLTVARRWKLANARTARIFHDSQPGSHKNDPAEVARMSLANRHYVMTEILGRRRMRDYVKLAVWTGFMHLTALADTRERRNVPARFRGELRAICSIRERSARSSMGVPGV